MPMLPRATKARIFRGSMCIQGHDDLILGSSVTVQNGHTNVTQTDHYVLWRKLVRDYEQCEGPELELVIEWQFLLGVDVIAAVVFVATTYSSRLLNTFFLG